MGKIETAVKSEITRLAKKEIRAVCGPLARDVRELKRTVSSLRKTLASLEKTGKEWTKQTRAQKAELKVPEEEVKAARFSPRLIRSLRKRLGLSQQQLATAVGVSAVSVGLWEQGKTRPTGSNRTALVALRKLGRRDVRKILELKVTAKPKKKRKATKKRAKKKVTKRARRKTR
jgi:DNA-binding transcriptional regulator YiaG